MRDIVSDSRIANLEDQITNLESQLAQAEEVAGQVSGENKAPAVARRALSLCERCNGLPELSINRCPVCRELQQLING